MRNIGAKKAPWASIRSYCTAADRPLLGGRSSPFQSTADAAARSSRSTRRRHRTAVARSATLPDSPQQRLLLLRPRRPCCDNLLHHGSRWFHASSNAAKMTMPASAEQQLGSSNDGANGGAADLHKTPASSWVGHEGAAAFDLRSDTMTTPTAAMLAAIQQTTLLDDVLEEDPTTAELEAHVAALTGKEAGLFVLSGTMGNQVALRSLLTQPPYGVLCDHRSHIIKYEAGGVSSLTGATVQPVAPSNGLYLTLEDVSAHAVLDDGDVHARGASASGRARAA
ncbi:hypothetical protein DL769_004196 [Monosporascus sp. CRB-8-3]|nr:hypothetical protein DL769_004196 [Monosporascus sp. CRB-8-3]